jgi:nicotinamidase-related amidase
MGYFPMLIEAGAPAVTAASRLVRLARDTEVQVIHCVMGFRVDLKGSPRNSLLAARARKEVQTHFQTPQEMAAFSEVVPEIGVEPEDLVMARLHGTTPMTDTGLDVVLRNLGVTTLVVGGVSLNVAVTGFVIEAVNRAYDVVIPRDAVAGIPPEYGAMMLDNSLSLIARLTTVDDLASIWGS